MEEKKSWCEQFGELCKKHKIDIDSKGYEKLEALNVDDYFKPLILQIEEFAKSDEEDITLKVGPVKIYAKKQEKPEKIEDKEKLEELIEEEELDILRESCLEKEYNKKGELTKVKVLIPVVVEYLLNKHNFKTIFGSKSEEIFVYQDGIYTKNGREIVQTQTEKILKEYCSNHYIKEIVEKVKRLSAISKEKFDNIPEELICLENGILNLKTQDFSKHDPKYYFKNKFPIEYDGKADCPKIEEFFENILYPEDVKVVQEWFGFSLYRNYFIKKAVILFGETDTGKTALLDLLISFIGEKNAAGISLHRISVGDKFALSFLKDKYINVFDDLSSRDLIAGGFKVATGGGSMTAEHKFGDSFQFHNFAKHIFATNKIPSLKEIDVDDKAYYDRWMPIPFDNQIKKNKQDKFFIKNLIAEKKEMSGLLNYSLEGLKRLLENGKFSFNKTPEEIQRIMERYGDPLSAFCQEILVRKDGNRISKNTMFEIYSWYVNDKKLARLSKEQLGRRLEKYISYVLAKRDAKERYWENVDVNPNLDSDILDTITILLSRECSGGRLIYKNSEEASKTSKNIEFKEKPSKEPEKIPDQLQDNRLEEEEKKINKEVEDNEHTE